MYMADWITKLDDFLRLSEREILRHAGRISHDEAAAKAELEYDRFASERAALPGPVEKHFEQPCAASSSSRLPAVRRSPGSHRRARARSRDDASRGSVDDHGRHREQREPHRPILARPSKLLGQRRIRVANGVHQGWLRDAIAPQRC
jgi:hypothetical protein